ncbi:MAG: type IV toxin-antitoxin system AbiEi family antitoxin [Thermoanaerobaculia bacterium]
MTKHNPIETYLRHLWHLPFIEKAKILEVAPAGYQAQPDALLLVTTPQGDHRFLVEEKRTHLTYTIADGAIAQMERETRHPWILFAPYVAPPMARHLMENGVFFVDRVGNCHLAIGQEHIVQIEGRKPDKTAKKARGIGTAGHQALFAILAKPELLNTPVRTLAEAAGIGKTAAAETLRRFEEEGVIGRGERQRHLLQRDLLLDRWLTGYENFLRPRLTLGTFLRPDPDPEATEEWIERHLNGEVNWAWGGGTAAMRLTGYYRGEGTVLYVEAAPFDLQNRLQAIPARDGPLTVLQAPGPVALEGQALRTVHPLLVYTDLLGAGGERARDAAHEIRQRYLEKP